MNKANQYTIYSFDGKTYCFDRLNFSFFELHETVKQEKVYYHKDVKFYNLYLSSKIFKPLKRGTLFVLFCLGIEMLFFCFTTIYFIYNLFSRGLFLFSLQWFWGLIFLPTFFIIFSFVHEIGHVFSGCFSNIINMAHRAISKARRWAAYHAKGG